ncbi:MAG: hypothetical protein U0350_10920 [Caldilineaceae bacterium]
MSRDPTSGPPYMDWRIDRWKLALLFCLLLLLLLLALFWPESDLTAYQSVNFL